MAMCRRAEGATPPLLPLVRGDGMQKEEIFACAQALAGRREDYPFKDDFETAVFRHADTRKWFGIWLAVPRRHFAACGKSAEQAQGAEFCLNVKCPPDLVPLLAEQERGVYPAYHMNRRHWVTVRPSECASDTAVRLLELSFALTVRGAKR